MEVWIDTPNGPSKGPLGEIHTILVGLKMG
jgi:hypothetical protein